MLAGQAQAGPPPDKAAPCAACHGAQGQGMASQKAPRLAGLNPAYTAAQLDAFGSGARASPVMAPIARNLAPKDRTAVAAWFASLPANAEASAALAQAAPRGRQLAERGAWAAGVPPCAGCHGPAGAGVGAVVPPLAGQGSAYLLAQLDGFRGGARRGDPLGLMAGVAKRLSPDDLKAAAAYYAALPVTP
jgi:cytochrome c553